MSFEYRFVCMSVVVLLSLGAKAGHANSWWWTDGAADSFYASGDNWRDENHNPGPPSAVFGEPIYITTSNHNDSLTVAQAIINSSVNDHTNIYIGGWDATFDNLGMPLMFGNPWGHSGTLFIEDDFTSLARPNNPTGPDCHYMRVGTRGARGHVVHTNGTYDTCTQVTLSYVGAALGIYELSGGAELSTYGFEVGGQGTGFVEVSGGSVTEHPDCAGSGCVSRIGLGYTDGGVDDLYIPGSGLLDLRDSSYATSSLRLGMSGGAPGILAIHQGASLTVGVATVVGKHGIGSVVQTGGQVEWGASLEVGREQGGTGSYAISGGMANQSVHSNWVPGSGTTVDREIYLGRHGSGTLLIAGGDVYASRLDVGDRSRLTFVVGRDNTQMGHLSVIGGDLTFHQGSTLDIDIRQQDDTGNLLNRTPQTPRCPSDPLEEGDDPVFGPPTYFIASVWAPGKIVVQNPGGIPLADEASDQSGLGADADDWTVDVISYPGYVDLLRATYDCS